MTYNLRPIQKADLNGKKVLIRVDYDVVKDGKIKDDDRLVKSLPTIQYAFDNGASQVILIAHNGKPKGQPDEGLSLLPVKAWLNEHMQEETGFIDDCIQENLPDTPRLLLLENLRFHEGEKKNDPDFAKTLASYADVFISNAFATAHRAHASMVGIPKYLPSYAGLILQTEVEMLSKVTDNPTRPFYAIVGFAKISDKIDVLENLLKQADKVLVGGAVIFTFFKAMGYEIGKSLVEDDKLDTAKQLLATYREKLILPTDITIADSIEGENPRTVSADSIPSDAIGLDIGSSSAAMYIKELESAQTVFWNGPVGMFEKQPFDASTNKIAQYLAETDKTSIIGGGDTTKAMKNAGVYDKLTHISTGGGASLEFVQGTRLPGLVVLER
jgi:phosphoglycerate kinase